MNTRIAALEQAIKDLEYVRTNPGAIDMLLEKRRMELTEAMDVESEDPYGLIGLAEATKPVRIGGDAEGQFDGMRMNPRPADPFYGRF